MSETLADVVITRLERAHKPSAMHSRRVAAHVARVWGPSFHDAALLHDAGKLHVPRAVLCKRGRFNDFDIGIMRRHTLDGPDALCGLAHDHDLPLSIADYVLYRDAMLTHHLWYDGRLADGVDLPGGYPKLLYHPAYWQHVAGKAIPVIGRMIALCDVFDALTHPRVYRRTVLTPDQAIDHLIELAGRHFDPDLVWDVARDHERVVAQERERTAATVEQRSA